MKKIYPFFIFFFVVAGSLNALDEPVSLAKDQLAWGESQLRQMLKDRPAMAPYVKPGDDLWNWTVQQFAGEGGDGEVQWDSSTPTLVWDAMSCRADLENHKLALINISTNLTEDFKGFHKGDPKSGPLLWGATIFELINISHSIRGVKVDEKAKAGLLSRDAFIVEHAIQEYDSCEQFNRFFKDVWIPNCRKLNLPYQDEQLTTRMPFALQVPFVEDFIDGIFERMKQPHQIEGDEWDKEYRSSYLKRQKLSKK